MGALNNNNIRDLSDNNLTIINNDNIQQFGVSPFSHENFSVYFPKDSKPLTVKSPNLLNFRGNDFTIEAWVNFNAFNTENFHTGITSGFCILGTPYTPENKNISLIAKVLKGNNFTPRQTHISLQYNQVTLIEGSIPDVFLQKWTHIAITRRDNVTFILHIDGKFVTEKKISTDIINSQNFCIGGVDSNNTFLNDPTYPVNFYGYIADVRISNIARYNTINFTPPLNKHVRDQHTTFLSLRTYNLFDNSALLNQDSVKPSLYINNNPGTTIVPYSPYLSTRPYNPSLHNGSLFFNGNNNLQINTNPSIFNLSNSWTFETWIYPKNLTQPPYTQTLFTTTTDSTSGITVQIVGNSNPDNILLQVTYYQDTNTPVYTKFYSLNGCVFYENGWSHIQLIYKNYANDHGSGSYLSGDNVLMTYVNGIPVMIPDNTYNFMTTETSSVFLGSNYINNTSDEFFNGYFSGTVFSTIALKERTEVTLSTVWNTGFVLPTTPYTSQYHTLFLLNNTDVEINDLTGNSLITINGTLSTDYIIKKTTAPSYKFNGTDSYITVTSNNFNEQFNFLNDFTIEGWVYYNSSQTNQTPGIFHMSTTSNGLDSGFNSGISLSVEHTTRQLKLHCTFDAQGPLYFTVPNYNIPVNTWQHFALLRYNGRLMFFTNGIERKLTDNIYNDLIRGNTLCIGGYNSISNLFTGNLHGFRVTKDIARYTAPFTPPDNLTN